MARILILYFALTLYYFANGEECALPDLHKDVEWGRMKGKWFGILHAADKADVTFNCKVLSDFALNDEGGLSLKVFDTNYPEHAPFLKFKRLGNGLYSRRRGGDFMKYVDELGLKYDVDTEDIVNALEEELDLDTRRGVIFTDYKNYLIVVACGSKGERFLWAHTPHPHARPEDIPLIHNAIADLGRTWSQVKLKLTGCLSIPTPN